MLSNKLQSVMRSSAQEARLLAPTSTSFSIDKLHNANSFRFLRQFLPIVRLCSEGYISTLHDVMVGSLQLLSFNAISLAIALPFSSSLPSLITTRTIGPGMGLITVMAFTFATSVGLGTSGLLTVLSVYPTSSSVFPSCWILFAASFTKGC